MSDGPVPPEFAAAREHFLSMVAEIRPELHRYCSRLVGSAIDGEDVVQEALAKAFYAISLSPEVPPLRPWLFRIAHNTAIDSLRRYDRRFVEPVAQIPESAVSEVAADPEIVRAALSSFLMLPIGQRSAVILKDVLGHSLEEVADATGATVPAIKAALLRGRASLRAHGPLDSTLWHPRPQTSEKERALLSRYVELFNAHDWDGVRSMLQQECRLDLVSKAVRQGKGVGGYLGRYQAEPDLRFALGAAEGRDLIGVYRQGADRPAHVISLGFVGEQVSLIRDYRYVPYLTEALDWRLRQG